jgi:hypothetical protein
MHAPLALFLAAALDAPAKQLAREIYKEPIEINTWSIAASFRRNPRTRSARRL